MIWLLRCQTQHTRGGISDNFWNLVTQCGSYKSKIQVEQRSLMLAMGSMSSVTWKFSGRCIIYVSRGSVLYLTATIIGHSRSCIIQEGGRPYCSYVMG